MKHFLRDAVFPLVCLLFCDCGIGRAAEAARIAIIDTDPHGDLEPLLVAELSKTTGVELVERTEINRVVDEKRLSDLAGNGKFAGLGSLIRADGLLVIESIPAPGKSPVLTVRLISVKTGACLLATLPPESSSGNSKQFAQLWAVWLARDVARMAPKLLVTRENGIFISVLNIRASLLSPENSGIESSVTRLLESRLASVANVILLERRRLGDVQFERGLDATDLPSLANSTVIVDGAFVNEGQRDQPIEISLRVRQQSGTPLASTTVRGKPSDVPALAESVTTSVLGVLKQPPPNPAWDRKREACEFFDEAVWAWRAGAFATAREALAAARSLGDHSPDLAALEAWLFREQAWPMGYGDRLFVPERFRSPANEQMEAFVRAFSSLREFESSGGKLTRFKFETGLDLTLHISLVETASMFLRANDESSHPTNADPLREIVREAGGMGSEEIRMPDGLGVAARYCSAWARNSDELIAYYERLLRTPPKTDLGRSRMLHQYQGKILRGFPRSLDEALGSRFRNDPNAVLAWKKMLERLCADPATRLRALMARAGTAETEAQATDYREFLLELGRQGADLAASNQLGQFLHAIRSEKLLAEGFLEDRKKGGNSFHARFSREHTELFQTLCKTLPRFDDNFSALVSDLTMPEDLRQATWDAYCAYQDRCTQIRPNSRFSEITSLLLSANPGFQPTVVNSPERLLVHRFWHPYHLPSWQWDMLQLCKVVTSDGDVWILAQGIVDQRKRAMNGIFHVKLPNFESTLLQPPGVYLNSDIVVTPDALWMICVEGYPNKYFITRHDRQTGMNSRWPAPRRGRLSVANGRVFISFKDQGSDSGLQELDPKSGQWRLVISMRRNPPQSPLDDLPQWDPGEVIAGPGAKLYVAAAKSNSDRSLYELGNAWEKWCPAWSRDKTLLHYNQSSLIYGTGGVVFIDPEKTKPDWWVAGPAPSPEEQGKAPWKAPRYIRDIDRCVAFRPGELFVLERDAKASYGLRCWLEGGPQEGVLVPLQFQFSAAEKEFLEPMKAKFVDISLVRDIGLDNLINPDTMSASLRLHSTRDGLILSHIAHGFWFIPNDELRAAIQKARKAVDPTP